MSSKEKKEFLIMTIFSVYLLASISVSLFGMHIENWYMAVAPILGMWLVYEIVCIIERSRLYKKMDKWLNAPSKSRIVLIK